MIIKTDEYKKKIKQLAFNFLFIGQTKRSNRKGVGIDLDEILKICAKAHNVPESDIKTKLKYGKSDQLFKQRNFIWAAYYYGNWKDLSEISTYLGCYESTIRKVVDYGVWWTIARQDERWFYNELLETIAGCEKMCKNRFESIINEFDPIDANGCYGLNLEQISKIPIRSLEWFKGTNTWTHIYHINGKIKQHISLDGSRHASHLRQSQEAGFRFIRGSEFDLYKNASYCAGCKYQHTCALNSFGTDKPMFCPKKQKDDINKHLFVSQYALDFLSRAYSN